MPEGIKELTVLSNRLSGLLKDPQPGLFTWQAMVLKVLGELSKWVQPPKRKSNGVPKLTRKEWKTVRWLLHHGGRLDQCGLTERQVESLQKKINYDQVLSEWKKTFLGGKK
jgi:hypothetical protein